MTDRETLALWTHPDGGKTLQTVLAEGYRALGWTMPETAAVDTLEALSALRASTEGGEEIARVLYQCEKRRADHSDKVMGLTHSTMEPWAECKETFLADAAEVLAALSTKPTAGEGWRPIETAPKDRKALLLYVPENRCTYTAIWVEQRGWWEIFGGDWREHLQRATHWMPIPPAPAAPAKGEDA